MIHNNQSSPGESLKQLHSNLIAIADLHAKAKVSHEFLQYVFQALAEEMPCDSQAGILLDHLLTSYLAENQDFLRELKTQIDKSLEKVRFIRKR